MSKTDNLLAILWLLKSRRRMTARQIAEALEIHVRTVYRYIDSLCASGVPIVAESGHDGGYSLLESFKDSPLFFDPDEQKALVQAAVFAEEAGYPFGEALRRAVDKLKRYTNEEQLERIERHLAGFDVISPSARRGSQSETALQQLELAAAGCQTVEMDYVSGREEQPKSRRLDPYGIVYWKGNWYTVGYCHLRREVRSFRVDRIRALRCTEVVFERPAGFSARRFLLGTLLPDAVVRDDLVSVRIRGREQALDGLCDHWLFVHGLVERSATEALFRLDEETAHRMGPYFLLPYGRAIEVVEPLSLRERVAAVAADLAAHHRAPTGTP